MHTEIELKRQVEAIQIPSGDTIELPAGTKFACFDKPLDAWEAARSETPADGLIVIAGSVFLAGELRPHLVAAVSPPVEQ